MLGRGGASAPSGRTGGQTGTPPKLSRFALLLAANLFLVSLLLPSISFFEIQELKIEDVLLKLRGPRPVHDDIVIIEIEEGTLEYYNNEWPIARENYAALIGFLNFCGAKAVGLDLWFSGPAPDTTSDISLANVTAITPQLIHAVYFPLEIPKRGSKPTESAAHNPDSLLDRLFPLAATDMRLMRSVKGFIDLPKRLLDVDITLGHIALASDKDGVIRRTPLMIEHEGRRVPSLPLLMAANYLDIDWKNSDFQQGGFTEWGNLELYDPEKPIRIPVDKHGRAVINFPGGVETFADNSYLFINVVNSAATWIRGEEIPEDFPQPEEFEGKVVLVCNTAINAGIADFGPTPFAAVFPLAYAHASMVNAILRNEFVRDAPFWIEALGLAVIALGLALAFPLLPPARLAAVAVASIILLHVGVWSALFFGGIQLPVVQPLFLITFLAIGVLLRGYLLGERKRLAVEQELSIAHKIQQDLLPKEPLEAGNFHIAGINLPCFEIGGDYFDYFALGETKVAVAIGDVAGKGVPAALLMSNIQAILRTECSRNTNVTDILANANKILMESIQGSSKFITFFLAAIDPTNNTIHYSNAGHNPPLLVRADGRLEKLEEGGLLLGIFPMATFEMGETTLDTGDVLVMFTDGVTEAEDRHKNQYGDEPFEEFVVGIRNLSAGEIGRRICDEVQEFSKGIHATDDTTVVVVKLEPDQPEESNSAARGEAGKELPPPDEQLPTGEKS